MRTCTGGAWLPVARARTPVCPSPSYATEFKAYSIIGDCVLSKRGYCQTAVRSSHFVNSHFVNSHFVNSPLCQFSFGQLPTSSIPTLSIPIWSMLTKWELTKWELTKWEVDEVGIDKVHFEKRDAAYVQARRQGGSRGFSRTLLLAFKKVLNTA